MNLSTKFVLFSAAASVMGLAGGCQAPASSSNSAAAATPAASTAIRSDVTDIHPMETAAAPAQTAAYQVAAAEAIPQPVTYSVSQSAPMASITPPVTSASGYSARTPGAVASAGSTHTVRRGETLYSIARESYGSGKAWQKIAMANPGVTPSTLKVGQSLIIP